MVNNEALTNRASVTSKRWERSRVRSRAIGQHRRVSGQSFADFRDDPISRAVGG